MADACGRRPLQRTCSYRPWLLGRSEWQRTGVGDGNVQQLNVMERQVILSGLLAVRGWKVASAITKTVYGAQV